MSVTVVVIVAAFEGLGDEYCGKVREDESLYKCNQHFDQVDEERKQDEEGRRSPTQPDVHSAEDKDQTDKAEDDDMPRDHVGEKTHDQREGRSLQCLKQRRVSVEGPIIIYEVETASTASARGIDPLGIRCSKKHW